MTVDPPRRLRPRAPQRRNTVDKTKGAPSAKGTTAAARPVTTQRNARQYVPPVVPVAPVVEMVRVGDTSAAIAFEVGGVGLAIESTAQPDYVSGTTANINSVALAPLAKADGGQAVTLGYAAHGHDDGAIVAGWGAEGYGSAIVQLGENGKVGTATHAATGSVGAGPFHEVYGVNCVGVGSSAKVGTTSVPVDSSMALGVNATVTRDHEIQIGTTGEVVVVQGGLALRDSSGDLHKLVVSTGGVLSTVAYP